MLHQVIDVCPETFYKSGAADTFLRSDALAKSLKSYVFQCFPQEQRLKLLEVLEISEATESPSKISKKNLNLTGKGTQQIPLEIRGYHRGNFEQKRS